MYWTKRHVLVCTASHCSQKGANEVIGKLRLDIVRKGLDTEILVNNCGTIDLCDIGPNMVVYPDNVILRGVTVKDLPEIVEYLRGGPVPERLITGPHSPEEQSRKSFFAEVASAGGALPAEAFDELATRHRFGEGWVSEQQRRGFLARKAGEHGDVVSLTKKTKDRYSL